MVFKLISHDGKINYLVDTLNCERDDATKTIKFVDTVQQEYTITYTKDDLYKELTNTIDCAYMNDVSVDIYKDENDLKAVMDAKAARERKPGENPSAI